MKHDRSLGQTAAKGLTYVGAAQAVRTGLGIVTAIVTARILAPDDFGVVAMVAPITGFLAIFQNMGLNQATIQAKSITDEQVNALFWVTMAMSAAITAALLALSPVAAWFYSDPRAGVLTAASAVTVLLTGSALQHTALLNKHLRFKALSVIDMASAATAFVASVGFALWLKNFWAIWLGTLAGIVCNVALVWILDPWRPSFRIRMAGTRGMLTFGANLAGFNFLNFLSRNLDNVLIARVWGSHAVGLYDRSYRLMMFPLQNINGPLGRVMLPILGRLSDDGPRYRASFLTALRAIALVSVPGVGVAAAASDRLLPLLLGKQWTEAVPIFFWLSLAALTQPISNAVGWLFVTSGRTASMMRWGLFSAVTTLIAFVIGLPWGAVGVAMAYFISQMIRLPTFYVWATRGSAVRAVDLFAILAACLVGVGLAWPIVRWLWDALVPIAALAASVVVAYAIAAAVHALTPGGREAIRTMLRLSLERFGRRS